MNNSKASPNVLAGVMYAAFSYLLWGILPIYWKFLVKVPAWEILADRIFWSFVFVVLLVAFKKQWGSVCEILKDKRNLLFIFGSSVAITINWGFYIWAVNANHIVDTSLGYYINPLISIIFGVIFFKERLDRWQIVAVSLAAIGVVIMTIQYGHIPWIAFILAISFAIYGALKKHVKVGVLTSLLIETAMVLPFVLIYLGFKAVQGTSAYTHSDFTGIVLILGTGIVTAIPLLLFAKGAQMLKLSTLGFTQYIAPTLALLIGVFMFGEEFTVVHFISFLFIWIGLLTYSISQIQMAKATSTRSDSVQSET